MRTLCALLATIVANKSFPKQCQSLTHCSETIEPRSSAQKYFPSFFVAHSHSSFGSLTMTHAFFRTLQANRHRTF
ncbi:hypothetical protein B0H14DRAFT_117117 [Mycena olivaceomarginata]|nr:hypothetical protein B0H14DRAFT_117117 [Mycena olivaceomarginata]